MILNRLETDKRPYALFAFLWAVLLSAFIIVPIMVYCRGYFLYYGDFNVQEIPFYQLAHDAILNGETGWSHLTDLGANFIGSYSFYLLGSPFFWLTMALPSGWVAYAMGPLLMLKLGCASLSAYIFLKRYVRHNKYAVIGGVLYAFSGFSVYNIFFFHFHEAMIIFPLLLAALDDFHASGRKGVVALVVFASATVNYYFFIGQVVFAVIYYVIKLISKSYRFRLKEFLILAAECILGFLASMFLLLPAVAAITGNYRTAELINGWSALLYSNTQRYVQIFVSLFFPGDVPAKNNFTPSAGARWSSVAAYLPLFSMTFVIAQLRDKKLSFQSRLIITLLIISVIPVLNSAFQLFNSIYYARWFYMMTLITVLITVQSLDRLKEVKFWRGFFPTAVITLATAALIGLTPQTPDKDAPDQSLIFGLEKEPRKFWIFVIMTVIGLALTYILYLIYRRKPVWFFRATAVTLSLFIIGYSSVYLWAGKRYADRNDGFLISHSLNRGAELTLDDIKEVRSDFYNTSDNQGMFWQVPTIQAFHSIVPGALMDFYNNTGVKRDVGSRPPVSLYGLRALLSVKYLFVESDDENPPKKATDLMPGYRYLRSENGFDIYQNQHYVPMGFTYDQFLTMEEYSDLRDNIRHLALLKAMVLTQEQMEKYADITGYTDGMYLNLNFTHHDNDSQQAYRPVYEGFQSITASFDYTEREYYKNAKALAENACSSFAYTKDGFTAEFDNRGKDNLLFFSVPYDEGWSATVNGKPAEIEKVNIGFMAVRVPANSKSDIRFYYHTPLLTEGCIISCAALTATILYLLIGKGFRAKRKGSRKYRIKQKSMKGEA